LTVTTIALVSIAMMMTSATMTRARRRRLLARLGTVMLAVAVWGARLMPGSNAIDSW
jgi:hypothetical protein